MKLWHIITFIIVAMLATLGFYMGFLYGAVHIVKWAWNG